MYDFITTRIFPPKFKRLAGKSVCTDGGDRQAQRRFLPTRLLGSKPYPLSAVRRRLKHRSHQHVLVISALDVDSLCTCKILQALFKADDVQYTIIPVQGKVELQKAFSSHSEQVKAVVLINCGGSLNVTELLRPDEDVRIYIVDRSVCRYVPQSGAMANPCHITHSHRPVDLDNVYNRDQVTKTTPCMT